MRARAVTLEARGEDRPLLPERLPLTAVATANAAGLRIVYLKRSLDTRDGAGTIVEQTPAPAPRLHKTPRSSSISAHFAHVEPISSRFAPVWAGSLHSTTEGG
jgi:hypothetical protein